MSDVLWLAFLGFITSILTIVVPIIRARQDNAQKNRERKEDREYQEQIANKLAAKVSETADHASAARDTISRKLDGVKTLVNGNVTELLRDRLEGLVREVTLLEQNRELKLSLNQEIGPTEAATLELARAKLREARIQFDFKIAADKAVDEDLT